MDVILDLPAKAGSPIALTIGKFDGVHLGHRAVIEQLKQNASARQLPSCALTFDPHPIEFFLGARASPIDGASREDPTARISRSRQALRLSLNRSDCKHVT